MMHESYLLVAVGIGAFFAGCTVTTLVVWANSDMNGWQDEAIWWRQRFLESGKEPDGDVD